MNQRLSEKIAMLPPRELADVEDFVEFLGGKAKKRAALDRLLALAPSLEAEGAAVSGEDEIDAEIRMARAARS